MTKYKLTPVKAVGNYIATPGMKQDLADFSILTGSVAAVLLWGLAGYGGYHLLKKVT